MYTDDRNAYRNVFFTTWQKYQKKIALDLEEQRLIDVILLHPEFHRFLDDPKTHLRQEYTTEENPFLHLSLHLALREQIRLDRPLGINKIYSQLATINTPLEAEHLMLPVLVTMLNKGQQTGSMPSDEEYLKLLSALLS